MKNLVSIAISVMLLSCSASNHTVKTKLLDNQTFLQTEVSTNLTYGLSEKNPIQVGGVEKSEEPINERRFLSALAGPNGERISYYRAGSCCSVKSKNGLMGMAMLDNYSNMGRLKGYCLHFHQYV